MTRLPTPRTLFLVSISLLAAVGLTGCGSDSISFGGDTRNKMIVSVRDQKMLLVHDGTPV
jgi:hypothetical protein